VHRVNCMITVIPAQHLPLPLPSTYVYAEPDDDNYVVGF
jgi:hypothetical protein